MAHHDSEDVFGSSPTTNSASSSKKNANARRSMSGNLRMNGTSPLRVNGALADAMDPSDVGGSRFSLAHELAAALMPEPSTGSKLLDEFGIDYDEGAEGIDGDSHEGGPSNTAEDLALAVPAKDIHPLTIITALSMGSELSTDLDSSLGSPLHKQRPKQPEQDPMNILTRDMEATEQFLGHLRRIDTDAHASARTGAGSSSTRLEQIAADVIRRINDTARDRESQVRTLLGYEREFRKIAGEIGGEDVLGRLDELEEVEGLVDQQRSAPKSMPAQETRRTETRRTTMEDIAEEEDWEAQMERERNALIEEEDDRGEDIDTLAGSVASMKDRLAAPPPLDGPPTPAKTISQLSHLRTFTASLVTSLTTISEQTQVNGAATADAGRKIRALKNKMGDVRTDWEIAERSRAKIERWEAGIVDGPETPMSPVRRSRRADGRQVVAEHLKAFELAIMEAGTKTQAIMAGPA